MNKFKDDPDTLNMFSISQCSTKYLEALIEDIIDMSKLELNSFSLKYSFLLYRILEKQNPIRWTMLSWMRHGAQI